jgi:protein tyrosine/serine phosphatase
MKSLLILSLTACVTMASAASSAAIEIAEVSPGIYRGPAPYSASDYGQLQALGIKTVLDVRKFRRRRLEDECRRVKACGMTYKLVPVAFRPQRDGSAECALRALTDARLRPIYIHCELGRDRSGLVVALYRVRCEGWSLCAAYAEMERFDFNNRLRALENYFWDYAKSGKCPVCQ